MENKNNIFVAFDKLKNISQNLADAFNTYSGKNMKLTGYKDSPNYEKMAEAIKETTGIPIGVSTLRNLITLKHNGHFQPKKLEAIDKFISTYTNTPRSFTLRSKVEPIKQKTFWSVNQGFAAGMFINGFNGQFIEWKKVKEELETKVLPQCPRLIPIGSRVEMQDFYEKKNFVIWIYDKKDNKVGSVWIGGNPYKQWYLDGLVRIGITFSDTSWEVYTILQRYSDGSYRIVKSFV